MDDHFSLQQNPFPDYWYQWSWQQKNVVTSAEELHHIFPGLSDNFIRLIREHLKSRRLRITPYALSLIQHHREDSLLLERDPILRQLLPFWKSEGDEIYSYDGATENWEIPDEMVTPIAQHKYTNRVIIRLSNVCHSYCQFCYESLRTLEKDSSKLKFNLDHWESTFRYLEGNAEVGEVILSGGDPLMHNDNTLEKVFSDLRSLRRHVVIRIHTRALTYNPFRVTDTLEHLLKKYGINAFGVHVSHPNEITPDFEASIKKIQRAIPIVFANIPLLRDINDDVEIMRRLCMQLYSIGVIPHYLYHFMPYSPGSQVFRTSVQKGIDIVHLLKRHISNLAVPEFVLTHSTGKYTMPLLFEDERLPQRFVDAKGNVVIQYVNWQGRLVEYPDTMDLGVDKID